MDKQRRAQSVAATMQETLEAKRRGQIVTRNDLVQMHCDVARDEDGMKLLMDILCEANVLEFLESSARYRVSLTYPLITCRS